MAETVLYGEIETSNFVFQDLWNNRQKRKRSTTDVACLVIYVMAVLASIGIAIYAYNQSEESPFEIVKLVITFLKTDGYVSPSIFFFTWFCILLIVFYFIMLRWCTKFTVYLTIFLQFLTITLPFITIIHFVQPAYIAVLLFFYLIFWVEIQIIRKAGVDMICKIIVDACKASIAFPSSLVIALVLIFSTISLCTFQATVINCLVNNEQRIISYHEAAKSTQEIVSLVNDMGLITTFVLISIWILLVHYLSIQSVLHGMFSSWYRRTDKSVIPKFPIVLRHLFFAYRYHIGSFAFMSVPIVSLIQSIRTICNNIHILKIKFKESPYNIYCLLIIILNILANSSVACASYGKCFYPSMNGAFKILIQNPMKFTAARLVITNMIFFGLTSIPLIMTGLVYIHIAIWNPFNYGMYFVYTILVSIISSGGVLFIFNAAVDSVLFCHLEEELKIEFADEAHENN